MKRCSKCKEYKEQDNFYNNKCMKDGKECWCKPCRREFDIKKYKNTSEEKKEQWRKNRRDWKAKNPEKVKLNRRKNNLLTYGITVEQYDVLVEKQNGNCLICKNPPNGKRSNSKLHVDHNHSTGQVRGLLCSLCNRGLGLFREKIDYLKAAIDYLEDYA